MFTRITAHSTTILLVYVDDIIITGTDSNTIQYLQSSLQNAFQMKGLGPLTYFLGLEVRQTKKGFFLHQHKYVTDLVALAGLHASTPVDTTLELNVKLRKDIGDLLPDATFNRHLVGSLIYFDHHETRYLLCS